MDPQKKELYTAKRASGLNVSDPTLTIELEEFKLRGVSGDWVLLTLDNSSLLFAKKGSGVEALVACMDDSTIYYGFFKLDVGGILKCFSLYFVGESVAAMKKGKASMYKSGAFSVMEIHGEIQCPFSSDEFTADYFIKQAKQVTGVDIQ